MWAAEMRRWRVERPQPDPSSAADEAADGSGAEAPGVNVDPDPGPTEETLIAAVHAEATKRRAPLALPKLA